MGAASSNNNADLAEATSSTDSPNKRSRDASRKRSTSRGKQKFLVLKSTRPLTIPKPINLRTDSRGREREITSQSIMTASYTPQAQSTINLITKKFALNNRFTQFTTAAPENCATKSRRPGTSTALGSSKVAKTHNFKTLATFGAGARKGS